MADSYLLTELKEIKNDFKELLPKILIIITIFIFFAVLSVFVHASASDLNDGMLASWTFDTNQNEGTGNVSVTNLISSPNHLSSCKVGGCYHLNGVSSYITFTDNNFPSGNTEHSCAAWVKQTVYVNDAGIITFGTDTANQRSIFYLPSGGADGSTGYALYGGGGGTLIPSNSQITNGGWVLISYSKYSNGTIDYFYNGTYDGEEVKTGQNVVLNQGTIGNSLATGGSIFNGDIDEVRCWNKALTVFEQSEYYNRTNDGEQWPFFDSSTIDIDYFISDSTTNESTRLLFGFINSTDILNYSINRNGTVVFSSTNTSINNITTDSMQSNTTYSFSLFVTGKINNVNSTISVSTLENTPMPVQPTTADALNNLSLSIDNMVLVFFFLALFVVCIVGMIIGKPEIKVFLLFFISILILLFSGMINDKLIKDQTTLFGTQIALIWLGLGTMFVSVISLILLIVNNRNEEKKKNKSMYDDMYG